MKHATSRPDVLPLVGLATCALSAALSFWVIWTFGLLGLLFLILMCAAVLASSGGPLDRHAR